MSFIDEVAPHAQRIQKEYNILASIVIAQAIHESNWGKSGLATKGKNLFGIKGSYNGQSITMPTTEFKKVNGKDVPYQINAAFRKYPSWYESLCDLANLYKNGVSWDRNKYKKVIGEKNYKNAAKAVQAAGYATDPNYASKLIKTIESNNLTKYDSKTTSIQGGLKLYQPTISTLKDITVEVIEKMADQKKHGSKAIGKDWVTKAKKGQLTESDAIGLLYVGKQRGLI